MVDLQTDITNTLNHNGHDEVQVTNVDESFTIRVGYWERIDGSLIETMEEYHGIRITEDNWDDEDCGELFSYSVEIVEDGYSLSELMELESYNEENFGKWGIA